jgi:ribosomal-protein-alanine N-acetyltransferase
MRILESKRLILRKLESCDLDAIHAMRNDPDVMRYIREVSLSREESAKWMDLISALWDTEGIGYCAIVEKESGDIAGWCGTWKIPETGEIEVGYAVARSKWGNGYATEAAAATVEHAFSELGLERIVAVAYPENTASIKVMKKIGMKYVRTGEFYAKELVQYAIGKDEWNAFRGND